MRAAKVACSFLTRNPALTMWMPRLTLLLTVAALCGVLPARAQVTLTEGTNFTIDTSSDGRLAIDLLGGIWVLPATGGTAEPITSGLLPAKRPRWSPDSGAILYEAQATGRNELRVYRFENSDVQALGDGRFSDQQADWHPDGDRIVFASQRHDSGLDLWEQDLLTGLAWRISNLPGDESEPVWSADGRDLAYISEQEGRWALMLRRHGKPDRSLITSDQRLSAPAWRPDGSLISFTRHADDGLSISMLILSDPLLERTLIADQDLFLAPVAWLDRQQMFYAANGVIRNRQFNSWISKTVPFRATIGRPDSQTARNRPPRDLTIADEPSGQLVLRAARFFDGIGGGYREAQDIVIEGGRIRAIDAQKDRPGAILVDMGNLTILPGFIDGYAGLPQDMDESLGPLLLSFGVTTMVAQHEQADELNTRWAGKEMPGPRLLGASTLADAADTTPWLITVAGDMNAGLQQREMVDGWQQLGVPVLAETWQVGLGSGAALLLGGTTLPASPEGHRYQDMELATGQGPVTIISGLADAQTPGLDSLLTSRQATLLGTPSSPVRRFTASPRLAAGSASVVIGSKPNGMAPGIGLHAELRALAAAGLTPEQTLRAAGVNAAAVLGLGLQVGRIATGSVADLVIVDGDPLGDIDDALQVVGIVRNGRFFSTIGLIERLYTKPDVELFDKSAEIPPRSVMPAAAGPPKPLLQ
jgi:hypothetical protein